MVVSHEVDHEICVFRRISPGRSVARDGRPSRLQSANETSLRDANVAQGNSKILEEIQNLFLPAVFLEQTHRIVDVCPIGQEPDLETLDQPSASCLHMAADIELNRRGKKQRVWPHHCPYGIGRVLERFVDRQIVFAALGVPFPIEKNGPSFRLRGANAELFAEDLIPRRFKAVSIDGVSADEGRLDSRRPIRPIRMKNERFRRDLFRCASNGRVAHEFGHESHRVDERGLAGAVGAEKAGINQNARNRGMSGLGHVIWPV